MRHLHLVRRVQPAGSGYRVCFDRIGHGTLIEGNERADRVVLASGSIGTTELLLRCRDEFGTLPKLSRRLGHQWDADAARIDVGPAVESSHLAVLERQVADAVARGARIVAGGPPAQGTPPAFFPPTVLADCTRDVAVVSDETFGPILPIVAVEGVEEAVRLANDPPGGLSGSVWSRNVDRARDVADRLMTGSVSIDDVLVNYMCVEAPLGGTAGSGLGFRHGAGRER